MIRLQQIITKNYGTNTEEVIDRDTPVSVATAAWIVTTYLAHRAKEVEGFRLVCSKSALGWQLELTNIDRFIFTVRSDIMLTGSDDMIPIIVLLGFILWMQDGYRLEKLPPDVKELVFNHDENLGYNPCKFTWQKPEREYFAVTCGDISPQNTWGLLARTIGWLVQPESQYSYDLLRALDPGDNISGELVRSMAYQTRLAAYFGVFYDTRRSGQKFDRSAVITEFKNCPFLETYDDLIRLRKIDGFLCRGLGGYHPEELEALRYWPMETVELIGSAVASEGISITEAVQILTED